MYQCPNCGGEMRFDIPSQKLKCGYCESLMKPTEHPYLKGAEEETEFELTAFLCPQCGAEIMSQDNTAAAFCSFCGASTLLTSRVSKEKKPDAIIPFQKTKEDCIKAYRKVMRHALFAPNDYKDEKCIESFRGIYMPYWVYDVKHSGRFCLHGKKYSRKGSYDITKHYDLTGEMDAEYNGITHDASREFADDISESMAPYDVKEMLHFHPAYLSGFYADIQDVDPTIYEKDAETIASDATLEALKSYPVYKDYDISVSNSKSYSSYRTTMEQPHYALFPVWFMSYRKNDRVAYVAINGQTGKVATDIPIDYKKYVFGSLLLALPIFILLNFMLSITAKTAMILTLVLEAVMSLFAMSELLQILEKDAGKLDRGRLRYDGKKRHARPQKLSSELKKRWQEKKGIWGLILAGIAAVLSILILIINPVSDYIYYGGAFFSILAVLLLVKDIMKDYNILATRKLPQFDRKGGDDRVRP